MKKFPPLLMLALCSILLYNCHVTSCKQAQDEESVLAVLYQQQAGEYRALCLQAYNIARERIDTALKRDSVAKAQHKQGLKPLAIITDLDETALDNSESEAMFYKNDTNATFALLHDWWLQGKAKAVPGAVDFFNYAKSKGVHIYYISNRSVDVIDSTRTNMHRLGFPYTDSAKNDVVFRFLSTSVPTKQGRRDTVAMKDSVIVFLGDNLIDLDKAFDEIPSKFPPKLTYLTSEQRQRKVDSIKNKWGYKYIVFPNAIYGDWESALYDKFRAEHKGNAPGAIAQKITIRQWGLKTP